MAKKTIKKESAKVKASKESNKTKQTPSSNDYLFRSLTDVYERLINESIQSWSLCLLKKIVDYQPHKNHPTLRKINLDIIQLSMGKLSLTEEMVYKIETFENLLKERVFRNKENYEESLAWIYRGLMLFSIGGYQEKITADGASLFMEYDSLVSAIKKEAEAIDKIRNLPAYKLIKAEGKILPENDLMKGFQEKLKIMSNFKDLVDRELNPPMSSGAFSELGARLIFDTLKKFGVDKIMLGDAVELLPFQDEQLLAEIAKHKEAPKGERNSHYYKNKEILVFQIVSFLYGMSPLSSGDVVEIIKNKEERKKQVIPYQNVEESVFDFGIVEKMPSLHTEYESRLRDLEFNAVLENLSWNDQNEMNGRLWVKILTSPQNVTTDELYLSMMDEIVSASQK